MSAPVSLLARRLPVFELSHVSGSSSWLGQEPSLHSTSQSRHPNSMPCGYAGPALHRARGQGSHVPHFYPRKQLKWVLNSGRKLDPVLGGWPRIVFCSKSRHLEKISTGIYLIFRALFFRDNEEFGEKCLLGQPPRRLSENSNFVQNRDISKK